MSVALLSQRYKMRVVSARNPATPVCRISCRMVGGDLVDFSLASRSKCERVKWAELKFQ
jgi:hypothetical protein